MQTAGSSELRAALAQPTSAYRWRAWLAVLGLAVFIALYFGLAIWFLLTAWRLIVGAQGGKDPLLGYVVGASAAFLALFMLKAIFFVNRGGQTNDVEVKPAEQPKLFKFLYELADQAGAPRPHRVFLSARVNAAVFYDLSLLNLIFPSRKNLEIGLALVNCLSLGELRAVLAHEFGHFTQGAMAVGRYVYVAQQIAAHLVARRDKLDDFLAALTRIDLRIAWIGWILQLVVWSIRSLVESVFSVVVLMQRALSREMELQADLVAVSLTGSDALIHALHRLGAADDAWNRTLGFISGECAAKRVPRDAFAIQSRIMERMATLLQDPLHGRVPPLPTEQREAHRVFKAELAQPPQMWLTHPLNHEREANAKRRYIDATIDERSAWELFDDPVSVRDRVTATLVGKAESAPIEIAESLSALDRQFEREQLDGRYRGIYYSRSVVRCADSPDALYERGGAPGTLQALYSASLAADVESLRTGEKELRQLRALESGMVQPTGGVLRFRGKELKPARLPQAIAEVQRELDAIEERLRAHDRLCRSAHLAAAQAVGNGWPEYLRGLLAALHYADHTEANLHDAQGALANTYAVATATRKVSEGGIQRLIAAGNDLHAALAKVDAQRGEVVVDRALLERLKAQSWSEILGEFKLPPATRENIGDWLKHIDGWVNQIAGAVGALRLHALEELLLAETKVARLAREGGSAEPAPEPSRMPQSFDRLLPGRERRRQRRLDWWSRFQTAEGLLPGAARLLVAGVIVAAVLGLGGSVGTATLTLYNGLARPVTIDVNGDKIRVAAFGSARRELEADRKVRVTASTREGKLIESFDAEVRGAFQSYVYNVAGAAPLVQWTAVYGNVQGRPDRPLGAPRWSTNTADTMFAEPPRSIQTKGTGGTRDVLTGLGEATPQTQLGLLGEADQKRLIALHARWDSTDSRYIEEWLYLAAQAPDVRAILAARLEEQPDEIVLGRFEQESAGADRDKVCERHRARAEAAPQNRDLRYLAVRCLAEPEKTNAFIAGHQQWPDHGWFAFAAAYSFAERSRWPEAMKAFDTSRKVPPLADSVSVDMMRIYRFTTDPALLKQYKATPPAELVKSSEAVRQHLAFESGEGINGELLAYPELARGNLSKAMQLAGSGERQARLLRLAAASDGAPRELVTRALALKPETALDVSTAWAALALAQRAHRDATPYVDFLKKARGDRCEPVLRFVQAVQDGASPESAERLLDGAMPDLRGYGYASGAILLGERAPRTWRQYAKGLLYASERPYFN